MYGREINDYKKKARKDFIRRKPGKMEFIVYCPGIITRDKTKNIHTSLRLTYIKRILLWVLYGISIR